MMREGTLLHPTLFDTLSNAEQSLLHEKGEADHWTGELSTSPLSTATAIVALGTAEPTLHRALVDAACRWLVENQRDDGGWGDTIKSFSNISTTLLAWSALTRFGDEYSRPAVRRAAHWIQDYVGSLDPGQIAEVVKARYGKDRTFSIPILMLCAICGTLGPRGWRYVMQLPHWLAAFPRTWFAALRLPVVSYALPALISIGHAKWRNSHARLPDFLWPRLSTLLESIQPASGGFLEAAPLTSFVTMALVAAGRTEHPVVARCVTFLRNTVRPDGSWPIDTNLATWITTLSVNALTEDDFSRSKILPDRDRIRDWLLSQQYRERHPFTDAAPGGWAWTNLSGGVPDADDTSGALLALRSLADESPSRELRESAAAGVKWLLDLQNRNGGIPTFCRGWGALPFDRSSPDITAHALRAWRAWEKDLPPEHTELRSHLRLARRKAVNFLLRQQLDDGSWVPLWFGNQNRFDDERNPTYGTAKIVLALAQEERAECAVRRGCEWLIRNQNANGGWGSGREITPSSIEETALTLTTLATLMHRGQLNVTARSALVRGVEWLTEVTKSGTEFASAPIGFYFANLWYFEKAYPILWTVESLRHLSKLWINFSNISSSKD